MRPTVEPFFHEATGSYSYVVSDPASSHAAIIDPVLDYEPVSGRTSAEAAQALGDYVERAGLRVDWILETHVHADHLSAADYLRQRFGGRLGIGAGVREVQTHWREVYNLGDDFATDGSQFDRLFAEGDEFEIGQLRVRVLATPGHTGDGVSYLIGDAAFVGDTLFAPDCGSARCDFPGGSAATLHASIGKLYALADSTRIFLCHDYPDSRRAPRCQTTVAEEKRDNIHVRSDTSREDFVKLREGRDAGLSLPRLIFPSLQVNIRGGSLPAPEENGARYLKLPLNARLKTPR
jgi:glyoxylase-like metal-dependent hydrolase (beta-lactamase superfamily II)